MEQRVGKIQDDVITLESWVDEIDQKVGELKTCLKSNATDISTGIDILSIPATGDYMYVREGGQFFVPTLVLPDGSKICFGVVYWDGETLTKSAAQPKAFHTLQQASRYCFEVEFAYGGTNWRGVNYKLGRARVYLIGDLADSTAELDGTYRLEIRYLDDWLYYMPE